MKLHDYCLQVEDVVMFTIIWKSFVLMQILFGNLMYFIYNYHTSPDQKAVGRDEWLPAILYLVGHNSPDFHPPPLHHMLWLGTTWLLTAAAVRAGGCWVPGSHWPVVLVVQQLMCLIIFKDFLRNNDCFLHFRMIWLMPFQSDFNFCHILYAGPDGEFINPDSWLLGAV